MAYIYALIFAIVVCMNTDVIQAEESQHDTLENVEYRLSCIPKGGECERMADPCCPGLQCLGGNPFNKENFGKCKCQ
uniref:Omega-scoloptoxin(13)-Ssm2b n=1 Tax=Scolopendra mutilans TaxID=2836329 RepID=TXD2B_SCOMU|nr:RecName: Full=Omega-scoloptoxin(13)-Ssm2b; Short=Omega-SLPTX(13)-Ssm2b; AltName: Full=Omega-scoloptoxin-Ssm2b; Short=Omega-SLPTX-Ssm2b; Flags: Precursor [Scolopendra mutilans]AFM55008.1 putative Ca2+ channel inhibitor [Scolopendra subspinipes]